MTYTWHGETCDNHGMFNSLPSAIGAAAGISTLPRLTPQGELASFDWIDEYIPEPASDMARVAASFLEGDIFTHEEFLSAIKFAVMSGKERAFLLPKHCDDPPKLYQHMHNECRCDRCNAALPFDESGDCPMCEGEDFPDYQCACEESGGPFPANRCPIHWPPSVHPKVSKGEGMMNHGQYDPASSYSTSLQQQQEMARQQLAQQFAQQMDNATYQAFHLGQAIKPPGQGLSAGAPPHIIQAGTPTETIFESVKKLFGKSRG